MLIKEKGLYHSYFKSQEVANSVYNSKLRKERGLSRSKNEDEDSLYWTLKLKYECNPRTKHISKYYETASL